MSDDLKPGPSPFDDPPLASASLDAEERALRGGKGRMLAGMIVAAVLAVGALLTYLGANQPNPYDQMRRSMNTLSGRHFDHFWGCALSGYDIRNLKSDQDLRAQILKRADNGRGRYAAKVRKECSPIINPLEGELDNLIVPDDMQAPRRQLREAVANLRSGWGEFLAYLDGDSYRSDEAAEYLDKIARSWFEYRKTQAEIGKAVRDKL